MAFVVHITEKALDEIDEAMAWRSRRSVPRAIRWYLEIMEAIRSLADDAEQWGQAPGPCLI